MKTLNNKTVEKISILNEQLKTVEKNIYRQAQKTYHDVLQRLDDSEDDITDFEIEVEIEFRKDESDDEPLLSFYDPFIFRDGQIRTSIADGENHNVLHSLYDNSALSMQHHCRLLHALYDDYLILDWEKILSIRHIWFEVHVIYQYSYEISQ